MNISEDKKREEGVRLLLDELKEHAEESGLEITKLTVDEGKKIISKVKHVLTIETNIKIVTEDIPDELLTEYLDPKNNKKIKILIRKAIHELHKKQKGFPKGSVCKPCWELRYCPYGYLVEMFPCHDPTLTFNDIRKAFEEILENFKSGKFHSDDEIWEAAERLIYFAPGTWELLECYEPDELLCRQWGHCCPVFWSQSGATETRIGRREGRFIPRDIMLKVIRRDNHVCQECYSYVRDTDVEFDHIIPYSKGGPTSVDNIRLLCRSCNRKKSNALYELIE